MTKLILALRTGKSEAESASIAAAEIISSGGSYHFIPISHGDLIDEYARNPLTGYSLKAPKTGDMVRAYIYGPTWQGYWFDPVARSLSDLHQIRNVS